MHQGYLLFWLELSLVMIFLMFFESYIICSSLGFGLFVDVVSIYCMFRLCHHFSFSSLLKEMTFCILRSMLCFYF